MLTALGETLPVLLHGVAAFTVVGIYDKGGQLMPINEVEAVVSKPSLIVSPTDAARISKEHTIRTEDGDLKTFGGAVPTGTGLGRIELIKR